MKSKEGGGVVGSDKNRIFIKLERGGGVVGNEENRENFLNGILCFHSINVFQLFQSKTAARKRLKSSPFLLTMKYSYSLYQIIRMVNRRQMHASQTIVILSQCPFKVFFWHSISRILVIFRRCSCLRLWRQISRQSRISLGKWFSNLES